MDPISSDSKCALPLKGREWQRALVSQVEQVQVYVNLLDQLEEADALIHNTLLHACGLESPPWETLVRTRMLLGEYQGILEEQIQKSVLWGGEATVGCAGMSELRWVTFGWLPSASQMLRVTASLKREAAPPTEVRSTLNEDSLRIMSNRVSLLSSEIKRVAPLGP